jgi:hypothetical protein
MSVGDAIVTPLRRIPAAGAGWKVRGYEGWRRHCTSDEKILLLTLAAQ